MPAASCTGLLEIPHRSTRSASGELRNRERNLKIAAYIGGVLGLALLIVLFVRSDFIGMLQVLGLAGWRLLWLIPYRILFFLLYAIGWFNLIRPYDPNRHAGLGYMLWVTSVREAIDRLLPVASVGGGIAGVRLLRWRGLTATPASATVIVEILLTLIASYLFAVVGLLLLVDAKAGGSEYRHLILALLVSLPVPVGTALLLRYGSVFERLEGVLRPFVVAGAVSAGATALDHEVRACLRRGRALLIAGGLQFAALVSGSVEIWFVLRLFGHPVSVRAALVMESMTQAMRHLAFVIPGGLGVQEGTLVLFGHVLGVNSELALAVSMAKRMREVLCGLPSLASWQWVEGWRLRRPNRNPS
ncbi:MAG: lysylphosphatidylglycerol synthase domain-containing protein [Steroidobacteraceae bacterium]